MTRLRHAICWATVIIAIAVAARMGAIDRGSATTLLTVLPIAAWMALSGRSSCRLWSRA
jgi:hypothetical protein